MAGTRITIRSDFRGLNRNLDASLERAQYAFINQVYADTNKFVPRRDGDLRSQSQISSDQKSIVWNAPYARKQYYGVNFKHTTPGTFARWDVMAKAVNLSSWKNVIKRALNL